MLPSPGSRSTGRRSTSPPGAAASAPSWTASRRPSSWALCGKRAPDGRPASPTTPRWSAHSPPRTLSPGDGAPPGPLPCFLLKQPQTSGWLSTSYTLHSRCRSPSLTTPCSRSHRPPPGTPFRMTLPSRRHQGQSGTRWIRSHRTRHWRSTGGTSWPLPSKAGGAGGSAGTAPTRWPPPCANSLRVPGSSPPTSPHGSTHTRSSRRQTVTARPGPASSACTSTLPLEREEVASRRGPPGHPAGAPGRGSHSALGAASSPASTASRSSTTRAVFSPTPPRWKRPSGRAEPASGRPRPT